MPFKITPEQEKMIAFADSFIDYTGGMPEDDASGTATLPVDTPWDALAAFSKIQILHSLLTNAEISKMDESTVTVLERTKAYLCYPPGHQTSVDEEGSQLEKQFIADHLGGQFIELAKSLYNEYVLTGKFAELEPSTVEHEQTIAVPASVENSQTFPATPAGHPSKLSSPRKNPASPPKKRRLNTPLTDLTNGYGHTSICPAQLDPSLPVPDLTRSIHVSCFTSKASL
ncbi:hypothetical protein R3P38DRAFT_2776216 [Favolaschia claudopus]|uniref:Uncharacterized protein n=1 Tax=Favolaschia claudopus TaxID=2862362 RepID=A0AAW0BQF1_9AGAR